MHSHLLFLNLGAGEIIVIALFVLLFFGSKQIPELMRGLGRTTREFRDAMNGIEREVRSATNVEPEQDNSSRQEKSQGTAQDGPPKTVDKATEEDK